MEILLGVILGVAILFGVAWLAMRDADRPLRRPPPGDGTLDTSYFQFLDSSHGSRFDDGHSGGQSP